MGESEMAALAEYLVFPPIQGEAEDTHKWTHQNTLLLLELYKKYRDQVGSLKIKNIKRMFEEIAKEMQRITKNYVMAANCENRWKVLERNYKKYIDNINKTGSGKKVFEYYDIMHDILGKKKNINPVLLLSSDTIHKMDNSIGNDIVEDPEVEMETMDSSVGMLNDAPEETPKPTSSRKKQPAVKIIKKNTYENKRLKFNILKEIRRDRNEYYIKRLEMEQKKLEEKVKKNHLLETRNQLLEQILEKNGTNNKSLDITEHIL